MMNKVLVFFIAFILCPSLMFAQGIGMTDEWRDSGKIYVVVAVLSLIFIGISIYLFLIDRKLNRLEKQIKEIEER